MTSPFGEFPPETDEEIGLSYVGLLRETGDAELPHSLTFALEVGEEQAARSLGRALAASLDGSMQSTEVKHLDSFKGRWELRGLLAPRVLTEEFITALHRQLRQSAEVYDGHVSAFGLLRHPSRMPPRTDPA
jgi:hypothetical protein